MNKKIVKKNKFSYKKNIKIILRMSILLFIIIIWFGAMSTQSQKSINEQIFFKSRIVNGFGAMALLVAWGIWEWYISPKSKKQLWKYIAVIILFIISIIMINGIMGIISGSIALLLIITTYLLNFYNIIPIGMM